MLYFKEESSYRALNKCYEKIQTISTGKNIRKHKETCAKNRRKRKAKKKQR